MEAVRPGTNGYSDPDLVTVLAEALRWMTGTGRKAVEVLLVEDDQGDVVLITEAFVQAHAPVRLHVVGDGDQALQFLRRSGRFADALRLHRRDPADRPLV